MNPTLTAPIVRPATESDAAALRSIVDGARAAEFASLPDEVRATLLDLQSAAQTAGFQNSFPDALTCAIEAGGEVVGRIVVDETDSGIHIVDVVVAPAHRGAGVATAVIEGLLRAAAAASSAVSLSVAADNTAARRLYERLGFAVVGEHGRHLRMEAAATRRPGYDDYASRVGSAFDVSIQTTADAPATAVLESCERLPAAEGASSFVLRFTVAQAHVPAQGTFAFSAEGLASVALFVVPTGQLDGVVEYEAVFNQQEGPRP